MTPKLVRDFIPRLIAEDKRRVPHFYKAAEEEYWQQLKKKLLEEVHEFLADDNNIHELADIMEVVEALASFNNVSWESLLRIKTQKALSHGSFNDRIVLCSIKTF